jgi:hypothetical protein
MFTKVRLFMRQFGEPIPGRVYDMMKYWGRSTRLECIQEGQHGSHTRVSLEKVDP